MIHPKLPAAFAHIALCFVAALSAVAGDATDPLAIHQFTGAQSCASSSCHGGGARNEFLTYSRKDRHVFAAGILGKGTSLKIAEALGIGDPTKAAQCTVCHSPMEAVPASRLAVRLKPAPDQKPVPDRGVSCEACHGAAGEWLLFHTRKDVNYQQILGTGLRDLIDINGRANVCVACHLNIDEPIRQAGHPELFFELDAQAMLEPPHYVDARPSLGPRSWLTGQAVALREMSWKLAAKRDDRLVARWKALVWLLQMTESGAKELPSGEDFSAMQPAADRLARKASRELWTRSQIASQLKRFASAHKEFADVKADRTEQRRRAELLVPAIDRLWAALRKEGSVAIPDFEKALKSLADLSREGDDFAPAQFADALGKLEAEIASALKL